MITYYLGNGTTEPIIKVTISETDVPGELKFTISQSGPVVGDLRGLFIDSIESLAAGSLTVADAVYTYASGAQWHLDTAGEVGSLDFRSDEGSIVNLGGGANMSGALGTSGERLSVSGSRTPITLLGGYSATTVPHWLRSSKSTIPAWSARRSSPICRLTPASGASPASAG